MDPRSEVVFCRDYEGILDTVKILESMLAEYVRDELNPTLEGASITEIVRSAQILGGYVPDATDIGVEKISIVIKPALI